MIARCQFCHLELDDILAQKAAILVLYTLREVEVKHSHERGDSISNQFIDQIIVEFNSLLIHDSVIVTSIYTSIPIN